VGLTTAALVHKPRPLVTALPPALPSVAQSIVELPLLHAPEQCLASSVAHASWLRVASDGTLTPLKATRAELSKHFSLPARDARLLLEDCSTTVTNFRTAVLARERSALLLMRPNCRCVVSSTEAWVPIADGAGAKALANALSAAAVDVSDKAPGARSSFELRCLEAALDLECGALTREVEALEHEVASMLPKLAADTKMLEHAARLKGNVGRTMQHADGLRSELTRYLDDDSDMRSLDLKKHQAPSSRYPNDDADVQEVEDLLETYQSIASGICSRLRLIDEAIDDTEHYVARNLDARRNAFIGVNLCFSAAAFADRLWAAAVRAMQPRGSGESEME
jgi:hypothetical protein